MTWRPNFLLTWQPGTSISATVPWLKRVEDWNMLKICSPVILYIVTDIVGCGWKMMSPMTVRFKAYHWDKEWLEIGTSGAKMGHVRPDQAISRLDSGLQPQPSAQEGAGCCGISMVVLGRISKHKEHHTSWWLRVPMVKRISHWFQHMGSVLFGECSWFFCEDHPREKLKMIADSLKKHHKHL